MSVTKSSLCVHTGIRKTNFSTLQILQAGKAQVRLRDKCASAGCSRQSESAARPVTASDTACRPERTPVRRVMFRAAVRHAARDVGDSGAAVLCGRER